MKRHAILAAVLLIASFPTQKMQAQTPTQKELTMSCRHLFLDLEAEGFFFDAEYATPLAKGFSVTGFRLSPTLSYGISERAMLRVGINATVFAGLDSLYRLRPSLSLIYMPADWITLVAGTLMDDGHHRLPSPVVDPARHIYNYQEEGLQITTSTKHWKSDTWLDWTHYLTPWTPDQERFTMGSRHSIMLLHGTNYRYRHAQGDTLKSSPSAMRRLTVKLPFHFIASHRGGEVKTIDTNTVTVFNESVGLTLDYNLIQRGNKTHTISLNTPFYFYHLEDDKVDNGGWAFHPTVNYALNIVGRRLPSVWSFDGMIGLWHGDHYFSAMGSPIYWSSNSYSRQHTYGIPTTYDDDSRNLVTFGIGIGNEFRNMNMTLRIEGAYDIESHSCDLLFGFYMRYGERFMLR